jgi:hypothetical protein
VPAARSKSLQATRLPLQKICLYMERVVLNPLPIWCRLPPAFGDFLAPSSSEP